MNLLIVDLVLQVIEPHHLLTCRLVNHDWNTIATRLMEKAGWSIQLYWNNLEEYFELVKKAGVPNRVSSLGVNLDSDISGIWKGKPTKILEAAIQVSENMLQPPFRSLSISIKRDNDKLQLSLLKLIWLNATGLRRLSLWIDEGTSPDGLWVDIDFELPALRSLSIICHKFTEQSLLPLALTFLRAGTNLESLRLNLTSNQLGCELVMLSEIHADYPKGLGRLLKLELTHVGSVGSLGILNGVTFSHLHTFRTSCWEESVPYFVRHHCPRLKKLEITSWFRALPLRLLSAPNDQDCILPLVTHFTFDGILYFEPKHGFTAMDFDPKEELRIADTFLHMMRSLPNLASASLQFENFVALFRLFEDLGGNIEPGYDHFIPPAFRMAKWHKLKKLELQMGCGNMDEIEVTHPEQLSWLFNEMFPNLETLSFVSGNRWDTSKWLLKSSVQLGLVFRLIFEVVPLKHAEIAMHYHHCDCHDCEFAQVASANGISFVTNLKGTGTDLETVTIRIIKSRGLPYAHNEPQRKWGIQTFRKLVMKYFNLQHPRPKIQSSIFLNQLAIIPDQSKSNLLLRLDSRLPLLPSTGDNEKSFEELWTELQLKEPESVRHRHLRIVLF